MKQNRVRRAAAALLIAALPAALAASGLLSRADNAVSDALYQRPQALEGNIVLIGIDERALDALGPFGTWGRGVFADAIRMLCADPAQRPAVIGLDVVFAGETDPAEDAALAAAARDAGNVVVAGSASFGSALVTEPDGAFYMRENTVLGYDGPYAALAEAAAQAHVNAMYDGDGVLRHAIWQIDTPEGAEIPAFHRAVYRLYAEQSGLDPDFCPPVDAHGRWYVPFRAAPGGYDDGFSLAELLAGELPADLFADKIVLIGPYAAGLQDSYATAIDHAVPMYGVEYQANAIDALIARDARQEAPAWLQLAVLYALCALCLFFFYDRRVLPATLAWLLAAAGSVGAALAAYQAGYVVYALYLPLAVTVLYVASVAANYVRAAAARRRVTRTFQRYVAPEIVSELLTGDKDTLALGGRLTDIAVLFVDLRGFTALSEALPPEQVVELLNRCLTLTSECILRHGGTLDKFIGDCTMAFWGAPLPQEDAAYRAVCAARDMIAGGKALEDELHARFGHTVRFGVGVHCGPAVVGNVGSPQRMDYTAIGDTVNTASRLEANAPGGAILVSRAVAEAVGARVPCVPSGSLTLKGKAAPFEVFTIETDHLGETV